MTKTKKTAKASNEEQTKFLDDATLDCAKKTNWYDPYTDWEQAKDGCKPLFELFEELFGDD